MDCCHLWTLEFDSAIKTRDSLVQDVVIKEYHTTSWIGHHTYMKVNVVRNFKRNRRNQRTDCNAGSAKFIRRILFENGYRAGEHMEVIFGSWWNRTGVALSQWIHFETSQYHCEEIRTPIGSDIQTTAHSQKDSNLVTKYESRCEAEECHFCFGHNTTYVAHYMWSHALDAARDM